MADIVKILKDIVSDDKAVLVDEPMAKHTTFGVGGPADIFIDVASVELRSVVQALKDYSCPFNVIGNGSNLLVSDEGIRGAVICVGRRMSDIKVEMGDGGGRIEAASGALLPVVAKRACDEGLTGLEFATQIPGTIGGAVYMNAGAFGGDMSDSVMAVTSIDMNGETKHYSAEDLQFGYRTSIFAKRDEIITGAILGFKSGDPEQIREKVSEIRAKRASSQPVNKRSAGSTFRKVSDGDTPESMTPAWKLVQQVGMKDARVGGARVSEKHSGFVINDADATASDIYSLIKRIIIRVKAETGVTLEPEVKMLGKF